MISTPVTDPSTADRPGDSYAKAEKPVSVSADFQPMKSLSDPSISTTFETLVIYVHRQYLVGIDTTIAIVS